MSGNGAEGGHRTTKKSTPIDIRKVPPIKSQFKPLTKDVPQVEAEPSRSLLYVACAAAFIAAAILLYSLSR